MFKTLGSTKIQIFPIGFGTAFNKNEYVDSNKTTSCIKKAVELGINFFDTAESYGDGLSEKILGKAIQNKRGKILIATKFSPENSNYRSLIKTCKKSLKRLKTDYIDIYQSHWPNPSVPFEETISSLNYLLEKKLIRFVGLGNSFTNDLKIAKKILKDKLVTFQTELNLYEQSSIQNSQLKYCQLNNLNLIAYSPLDQGRISGHNELIRKLEQKYDRTFTQLSLNWLITFKPVIPIPKTTNTDHLIQNFNSINFKLTVSDKSLLTNLFKPQIKLIDVNKILISLKGERDRDVYQTLKQAIDNKLNFVPSPLELSKTIKDNIQEFKPIRLVEKNSTFELINGRIRYWAWVIAFKNKRPIPSIIRKDL